MIVSLKQKILQNDTFQTVAAYVSHQKSRKRLDRTYSALLERYREEPEHKGPVPESDSPYLWICWWQGRESMSPLVRGCVERIQMLHPHRKVVLITEKNMQEYVRFPTLILEKYRSGGITPTNMSDLLRCRLLAQYGGCWMDATLYLTEALPERFEDYPLYTGRYPRNPKDQNISANRWTSYFMMAKHPGNVLFCFLDDFWTHYWEQNDRLTEYFMIDYALDLAYRNIPAVRRQLDQVPVNGCGQDPWLLLLRNLSQPYDQDWMKKIQEQNWMQKLSYKGETSIQKKAPEPENSIYKILFLDGK